MMGICTLFKYLFGWDYIMWENTCSAGTSRVKVDGDGVAYYRSFIYGVTKIKNSYEVIWLTCPSSKYLKDEPIEGQL